MDRNPPDIISLEMQLATAEELYRKIVRSPHENQHDMAATVEALAVAQRALAEANGGEFATPHDIGFSPAADISQAVVLQTETTTVLTFRASRQTLDRVGYSEGYIIVHFKCCKLTKFGHPNDEALPGHPLYSKGLGYYGIYEVRNSLWIKQTTAINWVAFPNTPDSDQKHFIFTFHDSTFECIATGLRAFLSSAPYPEIFEDLAKELLNNR